MHSQEDRQREAECHKYPKHQIIIGTETPMDSSREFSSARHQPASFTAKSMLSWQSAEHIGLVGVAASSQPVKECWRASMLYTVDCYFENRFW